MNDLIVTESPLLDLLNKLKPNSSTNSSLQQILSIVLTIQTIQNEILNKINSIDNRLNEIYRKNDPNYNKRCGYCYRYWHSDIRNCPNYKDFVAEKERERKRKRNLL
jgi:hypothetical protein